MDTLTDRFEVVHALKVKGLANDAFLSAMTGLSDEQLTAVVAGLAGDGLAVRRENPRMSGTMLTAAGRAAYDELFAQNALDAPTRAAVDEIYSAFLPVNSDFKRVCASWQLVTDDTPNDHTDAEYDGRVIDDLGVIHRRITDVLAPAGGASRGALARLSRYVPRLDAALGRVRGGDNAAFARPMYDSYHDIWIELHQDLLLTASREREAADEA